MKMNYIGLACIRHDNALAIVNSEGEVVFAEATERSLQSKRAYNCAPELILDLDMLLDKGTTTILGNAAKSSVTSMAISAPGAASMCGRAENGKSWGSRRTASSIARSTICSTNA